MGRIIVGQKKQKTVDMGGVTVSPSQNITSGKKQELDEAKKLSEELAVDQEGESSVKAEDNTAEDGEGETEPEKKKVGRPKKSEE